MTESKSKNSDGEEDELQFGRRAFLVGGSLGAILGFVVGRASVGEVDIWDPSEADETGTLQGEDDDRY